MLAIELSSALQQVLSACCLCYIENRRASGLSFREDRSAPCPTGNNGPRPVHRWWQVTGPRRKRAWQGASGWV